MPGEKNTSGALRTGIVSTLAALLLLAGVVLSQAYPSTEAARLRNALLIEAGHPADFEWTPHNRPASFLVDERAPASEIESAARAAVAPGLGDWEAALALARLLTHQPQRGGAVQADVSSTYRAITEEGRGYCVDYVDVFSALARAAGLTTRQWAFSFDGFGGHGHTFVEVFDRKRDKWAFLDVFNNFHAVDTKSDEPLSALEFRDYVLGTNPAVAIRPNGPGSMAFKTDAGLRDYYQRGAGQWYLWWGDRVAAYGQGEIWRAFSQAFALASGSYPAIKVLPAAGNAYFLERMQRLRTLLIAAAVVWAALLVLLVAQLACSVRAMRRARSEYTKESATWA